MKRYKLYIFDLDGTIVNSLRGLKMCYTGALDRLGMKYRTEDVPDFIRESLQSTYDRFDTPKVPYEIFEKAVYEEYGRTLDPNSLPYPDALPALKGLKELGASMCIATKSMHNRAENVLEVHGLIEYFDHIVGYDDVKKHKPDPECLELCDSYHDFDKDDMVYVGDSGIDVIAAESFGIDSVYITRDHNEYFEGTHNITDLRELL